jgi:hypothetical protein
MLTVATMLIERSNTHDASKLLLPEREAFAKATANLRGTTYGSDEYRSSLRAMGPALEHHYANNAHHPEFFEMKNDEGDVINDPISLMNLVDLVEMVCDWVAATKRHDDGDIAKSLEINAKRFRISPQLIQIIGNTVRELFGE